MSFQAAGPIPAELTPPKKSTMPTLVCNECQVAPCPHFQADPNTLAIMAQTS